MKVLDIANSPKVSGEFNTKFETYRVSDRGYEVEITTGQYDVKSRVSVEKQVVRAMAREYMRGLVVRAFDRLFDEVERRLVGQVER